MNSVRLNRVNHSCGIITFNMSAEDYDGISVAPGEEVEEIESEGTDESASDDSVQETVGLPTLRVPIGTKVSPQALYSILRAVNNVAMSRMAKGAPLARVLEDREDYFVSFLAETSKDVAKKIIIAFEKVEGMLQKVQEKAAKGPTDYDYMSRLAGEIGHKAPEAQDARKTMEIFGNGPVDKDKLKYYENPRAYLDAMNIHHGRGESSRGRGRGRGGRGGRSGSTRPDAAPKRVDTAPAKPAKAPSAAGAKYVPRGTSVPGSNKI